MKNFFKLLFLSICGIVNAQIVNIPDVNFKAALLNYNPAIDINNNGEIELNEAQGVFELNVSYKNILNLEGIQSFSNLTYLNCSSNFFENLDVSQNLSLTSLHCSNGELSNLNVSQNQSLINLFCDNNHLTSLDVSENTNLKWLICRINSISTINVTSLLHLEVFDCSDNFLTNLNLSQNLSLEWLYCSRNLLNELELSNNSDLEILICGANQFQNIDLTENFALRRLGCWNNQLTSLDLTNNINLEELVCYENEITNLDISQNHNIESLICFDNQLINLNLKNSNNIGIIQMFAQNNPNLECIQVDDVIYANNQICNEPNGTGWCKDETASYSESCLISIEDFTTADFKLFPNPTGNLLNIQSKENIESVKIYSTQGMLVKESSSKTIDVSHLSAGMYFAQITSNGKNFTKKFLKE
ncbi:MAG: T9SS type A sorting domain-containing protein [Aequorivita sp.]|nr:T9SS type A sorting domain-containing protein [Aequorivita sp.]